MEQLPEKRVIVKKILVPECEEILKTSQSKFMLNTAYFTPVGHYIIVYTL